MSPSNAKTSPLSAAPLHASKQLLVDIDGLNVRFGAETVLTDVSLCVHAGEFIGLIGPNGAGKTTLLRIMLGLLKPHSGKVAASAGSVIGYIAQRSSLHDNQMPINVLEVVMLGAKGSRAVAIDALEAVDMADVVHKKFVELSGGQQQRVSIAKALASNPNILILDEPTTGIDEQSQTEFYRLLQSLQKRGITIVMVSHEIDTVLKLVERVICLNNSVLYDGPPEHFEADKFMPKFYKAQHRLLHHQHGANHA